MPVQHPPPPGAASVATQDSFSRAGYAVVRAADGATVPHFLAGVDAYFAAPAQATRADARPDGMGFRAFASGRRCYLVQDQAQSARLPVATPCWQWCHALALACLSDAAQALRWPLDMALDWPAATPQPPAAAQANLLRLFHYPPGTTEHLGEHVDLGLLTVTVASAPGLEVYDPAHGGWVDVEKGLAPGDVVVLAGETLNYLSNGRLPSCLHRVTAREQPRVSAVYHLRARGAARFDSTRLQTDGTGVFPTPFQHSMDALGAAHLADRDNVNEEKF